MPSDRPLPLACLAARNSAVGKTTGEEGKASTRSYPAVGASLLAVACGGLLLVVFPPLELELFARGAAQLAGLLSGAPVLRTAEGWLLPSAQPPVLVTSACSGADYFLIVAALLGWHLARCGRTLPRAALCGATIACPLAIAVNALRIATLAQMHRWFIPLLPAAYAPFLHMLTGVAVFLPALIAVHLLLEYHGRPRHS